MYDKLSNLNISLTESEKDLFNAFSEYFLDYNSKVNLISNNDAKVLFEKHIYDSLALNLFFEKYKSNKSLKVLDIGTGGGFPSLPCALKFKNINFTSVDSIKKKISFIQSASEKFDVKNIKPMCTRVEELPEKYKNNFDVVTTRAMAELRVILEYALPYVKTGGYFVAYKSIKADEEIQNAKNALKILNSRIVDKIEYSLPIEEENKRLLLVIKKEKDIPSSYPRQNGLVKKKPL